MKRSWAIAVLMSMAVGAGAQEYGRGSLSSGGDGLGQAPLTEGRYDGFVGGGAWGVKAGLGLSFVNWDIGSASGSDDVFVPQVSFFYKTTDHLDVNVSALFLSADGSDGELGDNEVEMARLALGLRYWFNTRTRIVPYVGAGLGYYLVDGSTDRTRQNGSVVEANDISVDNAPGGFVEGGVAFQVADDFFINAEMSYDFLLGSADAEINGGGEDFDVSALMVGLGFTWMF